MKTLHVVTSVVLASIFSCVVAIAAPPMPNDVQIVQPDPSLPKELAAFFGKWEGTSGNTGTDFLLIVEKIDEEKASIYIGGMPDHIFLPGGRDMTQK